MGVDVCAPKEAGIGLAVGHGQGQHCMAEGVSGEGPGGLGQATEKGWSKERKTGKEKTSTEKKKKKKKKGEG